MPEYTMWNAETGEIDHHGHNDRPDLMSRDGFKIKLGTRLSAASHRFDPVTEEAYECSDRSQIDLRQAVNNERQRRIVAGKEFDGVWLTGGEKDQVNLLALKDTARDMIAAGVKAPVIPFRDGNNVEHALTPQQMIDLANAGKAHVSGIYQASWSLKAMDPIPQDVESDARWPG